LNFAEFVDSNSSDFYVQHEWAGTINLRIEKQSHPSVLLNKNLRTINTRSPLNNAGVAFFRPISQFLLKILRHFRKFEH
jgi:hypothetical protein